jgi:hypothetical protein
LTVFSELALLPSCRVLLGQLPLLIVLLLSDTASAYTRHLLPGAFFFFCVNDQAGYINPAGQDQGGYLNQNQQQQGGYINQNQQQGTVTFSAADLQQQ